MALKDPETHMTARSQEQQFRVPERLRNEFPGSSLGGPKIQAQIFIRKTWDAHKDKVDDGPEKEMLNILLRTNLENLSDEEIMRIVDHIRMIRQRLILKNVLEIPESDEKTAAQ